MPMIPRIRDQHTILHMEQRFHTEAAGAIMTWHSGQEPSIVHLQNPELSTNKLNRTSVYCSLPMRILVNIISLTIINYLIEID